MEGEPSGDMSLRDYFFHFVYLLIYHIIMSGKLKLRQNWNLFLTVFRYVSDLQKRIPIWILECSERQPKTIMKEENNQFKE